MKVPPLLLCILIIIPVIALQYFIMVKIFKRANRRKEQDKAEE
ncbi:MAG: hypothetical protein ACJ75J_00860 [Cytophagaceae bacterium]